MLKINYEHIYGSQEKHDLQLTRMTLDQEQVNEEEALESGWLISNGQWYPCRSVRICVDQYKNKLKLPKIEYRFTTYNLDHIKQIHQEYKAYKKFDEEYDIFQDSERTLWLIGYDEGQPVIFTKFIRYWGGLESQFTCWNYHKPKMQLGKYIVDTEVWYAKTMGLNYLYIGQGYEKGSLYKADFPGFEWWTGNEWSKDKQKYKELCLRDSTINTIDDLAKVFHE